MGEVGDEVDFLGAVFEDVEGGEGFDGGGVVAVGEGNDAAEFDGGTDHFADGGDPGAGDAEGGELELHGFGGGGLEVGEGGFGDDEGGVDAGGELLGGDLHTHIVTWRRKETLRSRSPPLEDHEEKADWMRRTVGVRWRDVVAMDDSRGLHDGTAGVCGGVGGELCLQRGGGACGQPASRYVPGGTGRRADLAHARDGGGGETRWKWLVDAAPGDSQLPLPARQRVFGFGYSREVYLGVRHVSDAVEKREYGFRCGR